LGVEKDMQGIVSNIISDSILVNIKISKLEKLSTEGIRDNLLNSEEIGKLGELKQISSKVYL